MLKETTIDYYGNEIKKIVKDDTTYLQYEWKGHKLLFLEEDVDVYEHVLFNPIEMAFPIYAKIDLKKPLKEATTEEIKDAILHGANEELSLYGVRLEEQAKGDVPDPTFEYNERVGLIFFRTPQDLEDEETADQHQNRWCIMQRCGSGERPKVYAYAEKEKYDERLKAYFLKHYFGKGYDLFFHKGNGEGYYEEFPNDDKDAQAEWEKDGVHYYSVPQDYNDYSFSMKGVKVGVQCYRIVKSYENGRPGKIVCYAITPEYNAKVLEVYENEYSVKGYRLLGR